MRASEIKKKEEKKNGKGKKEERGKNCRERGETCPRLVGRGRSSVDERNLRVVMHH